MTSNSAELEDPLENFGIKKISTVSTKNSGINNITHKKLHSANLYWLSYTFHSTA